MRGYLGEDTLGGFGSVDDIDLEAPDSAEGDAQHQAYLAAEQARTTAYTSRARAVYSTARTSAATLVRNDKIKKYALIGGVSILVLGLVAMVATRK